MLSNGTDKEFEARDLDTQHGLRRKSIVAKIAAEIDKVSRDEVCVEKLETAEKDTKRK